MTHTENDNRAWYIVAILGIIVISVLGLVYFANAESNLFIDFREHQLEKVKEITYERAYLHSINASLPNLLERQSFCIELDCLGLLEVDANRFSSLGNQLERLEQTKRFLETNGFSNEAIDSVNPNITNSTGFSYP